MENVIPKNTPEIGVSGGFGRIVMVKLGRKAMKTGVVAELGCGGHHHCEGAVLTEMAST